MQGPRSGSPLTRMGHPGAPDHDHHRSVWFAHQKLLGIDFWSDNTPARIRQQQWLVYEDGDQAAGMAVRLGWYDGHDPQPLIEQELIAYVRSLEEEEYTLELQSTLTPFADEIEFQQTNLGFLAVRVAKSISTHFGGGHPTGSSGKTGESALFGQPSSWMDYSGPVPVNTQGVRDVVTEGITYFDHPDNLSFPSKWHVRGDGWMSASVCRDGSVVTTKQEPLQLRYLLHAHQGPVKPERAADMAAAWAQQPRFHVIRAKKPHHRYEIERI